MKIIRLLAVVCFGVVLSATAYAVEKNEHQAHHPDAVSTSKTAVTDKGSTSKDMTVTQESMKKMDKQMKSMHDMHEKMMSAKTPAERKAHMAEHMKTMQSGMAMMNDVSKSCDMCKMHEMEGAKKEGGSGSMLHNESEMKCAMGSEMSAKHQMIEKRMKMMEAMMQMMMDRLNSENFDEYAQRTYKK